MQAEGSILPVASLAPVGAIDIGVSVEAPASVSGSKEQGPPITLGPRISNWAAALRTFKSIPFPTNIEKYIERQTTHWPQEL